ncbi:MAG: hypothetical protein H0W73_04995 [Bacteroidetes bacterium]|nr:hypothetical protein [Bacteroidota bacterium]
MNGMEKDDEIKGSGNSYDFGARIYDPRLGKWLSVDPMMAKYPDLSPYTFVANSPILLVDKDGRDFITYIKVKNAETGKSELHKVTFDGTNTTMQNVKTGATTGYAPGTSQFVDDLTTSYKYIVDNGADVDNAMKTIATSKDIHVEVEESKKGRAEYSDGTILIDFNSGLEVYDDETDNLKGTQSPALGFWSEVYHAYIDKVDKEAGEKYKNVDKQEEYVHVEKEQQVVKKLQEKDPTNKEPTRNKYSEGQWDVKTKGPTSTEPKETKTKK